MSMKKVLGLSGVAVTAGLLTLTGLYAVLTDTNAVTSNKHEISRQPEVTGPAMVTPDMESHDPQDDDYQQFEATAYCDYGITFSGVRVQRGIVAADPEILPIGSVIDVQAGDYSGIYMVMDTGGKVKGTMIDIYMPDYDEAVEFGRRPVVLKVLRHGWLSEPDTGMRYTNAG